MGERVLPSLSCFFLSCQTQKLLYIHSVILVDFFFLTCLYSNARWYFIVNAIRYLWLCPLLHAWRQTSVVTSLCLLIVVHVLEGMCFLSQNMSYSFYRELHTPNKVITFGTCSDYHGFYSAKRQNHFLSSSFSFFFPRCFLFVVWCSVFVVFVWCSLFVVWRLLFDVCCLLLVVCCLLFVVWRLLFDVCCLLLDACCLMFVVWRLSFDVCCLLFVVYCLLFDVCCLTFIVCCLTLVICCLRFDVCCLMFVAWCLLFDVCCLTFIVCCLTLVICCLRFDVCCLVFDVCCLIFVVC